MTHQHESSQFDQMVQVLDKHGFDGMACSIEILVNEAMKFERSDMLGIQPYERTNERHGYAIGQNAQPPRRQGPAPSAADPWRRVLSPIVGARRSQRSCLEISRGRDVRPGQFYPQGDRDHQRTVRPGLF